MNFLQSKVNQITFELAEARKTVAYKSPNTQILNEQIDSLKNINQLQKNEIQHLRDRITSEQAPRAENTQANELKDLRKTIAAHEKTCKEAIFEHKFQNMAVKYEKLERQKDKIQLDMNTLYREFSDYQKEKEQELNEKMGLIIKCEEEHGNMKSFVKERDEVVEKSNALRKTLADKQTKKKTSTPKGHQRPKSTILPQSSGSQPPGKVHQPFKVQPQQPVKIQNPGIQQQPPQQVHQNIYIQQQPIPSSQIISQSMQHSVSHQQIIPSKEPVNNLKWQIYVAPLIKKQKLSNGNPQLQPGTVPTQRAITPRTGSHLQKISPRPPPQMNSPQINPAHMNQPYTTPLKMNPLRDIIQWPGTPIPTSKKNKRKNP